MPLQTASSTELPVRALCLPVQANCLALHEFGKDLERHVGSVNMAAILVASAVGSGLAATHFGLGASAVPLGASGGAPPCLFGAGMLLYLYPCSCLLWGQHLRHGCQSSRMCCVQRL